MILSIYLLRRPLPEKARIGVLMLLAGAWWALAYSLELLSVGLTAKLFWAKFQYIGIVLFPISTLVMGILYTGRNHWLTRWSLGLLTILGFLILLLVFTTEDHHLFWRNINLNAKTIPSTLQYDYAEGFWAFMGFVNLLTWSGLGLMLISFIKSPMLHRRQIRALIVSVFVLVMAIMLNTLDIGPAAYINLQPYAVLVVCIAIGWGAYRLQLGDIVPVAYMAVIESIPDAVVILNANNRILTLNAAAQNLLNDNDDDVIGRTLTDCCPNFSEVITAQNNDQYGKNEISLTKKGLQYTYEIQRSPVLDGRGRLASQVVIIRDISNQVQAERERQERHRYLQALWSSVPDAIVVLDAEKHITEWSEGAERIFNMPAASALGNLMSALVVLDLQDGLSMENLLDKVWQRNTLTQVKSQICRKDGSRVDVLVSASPVIIDNQLNGAVMVYTDISELKHVETSLRLLNEELEQRVADRTEALSRANIKLTEEINDHQKAEIELVQRNRELLSFQAAATATSSSLDIVFVLETLAWEMIDLLEVDGCCVFQLVPDTDELVAIADYAAIITNKPTPERRIHLPECEIYQRVMHERFAKVINTDENREKNVYFDDFEIKKSLLLLPMVFQDRVVGLVELAYDDASKELSERQISLGQLLANQAAIAMENANLYNRAQQEILERQRAEVQIKASLKEKEMLLQEIHHRVKNNLQVISSLLSLQSRSVADAETLTVLRESQDRIRSMALIHEKLYRSENFACIDFAGYLQSLTSHLIHSYRSSMGVPRLQLDVADVSLSLETAVPCGLIVNELVSNALKHAFSDGNQGTIHITLSQDEDKRVSLIVADDGVGLPEGFDINKSDSLGLRLVTMLVGQVRGQLTTTKDHGAKFEVVFFTE
jgi:PAS domain S-box-containing protein